MLFLDLIFEMCLDLCLGLDAKMDDSACCTHVDSFCVTP